MKISDILSEAKIIPFGPRKKKEKIESDSEAGQNRCYLQIYIINDKDFTKELIARLARVVHQLKGEMWVDDFTDNKVTVATNTQKERQVIQFVIEQHLEFQKISFKTVLIN